jgi:hypothetical protein
VLAGALEGRICPIDLGTETNRHAPSVTPIRENPLNILAILSFAFGINQGPMRQNAVLAREILL